MNIRPIAYIGILALALSTPTFAGPPFLTDDPEPVPYHHWEFYTFATGDRTRDDSNVSAPGIEVIIGVATNTQLLLVVPYAYMSSAGTSASGLGDIEVGVKYRFVDETRRGPEIGIFPLLELPTGNQNKGLGNGRSWGKLPVWLQKSWKSWTSYGGGGYAFNNAPGQRNYWFGGDLIQCSITPKLTLGAELFAQGADAADGRSFVIANAGGMYSFTPDFSLLFSAGRTIQGEGHQIYYLALYRTWGPGAP